MAFGMFWNEIGMSRNRLARATAFRGTPHPRDRQRHPGCPADTDLRLCKFFALSKGYFMRL